MDELVSLIGNIGFPIAVSVYLLTVFGAKLDHMQASLDVSATSSRQPCA